MADSGTHLLALIFACIFFGYAMVNSLVFYQRARRIENYRSKAIGNFVKSPHYGRTIGISGIIGAVGFAIASWKLTWMLWRMMHAS